MIPSKKSYQFRISQIILNTDNNPNNWSEDKFENEVIIGYIFKTIKSKFDTRIPVINLYLMNPKYLSNKDKIISITTLRNIYEQWLESLIEDKTSIIFKNPPVKEWIETKDNWIKKLSHKLSVKYNKTYDECLSSVHMAIMKCYSKSHVYMGSLNYIELTAHNEVKMQIRFMKNRLSLDNPKVTSLNEIINEDGEGIITIGDMIGKEDEYHEEQNTNALKVVLVKELKKSFSDREIDQIINAEASKYLPMNLYRRLLKWRTNHSKEDYIID